MKDCSNVIGCYACKGNKNCKEYANWNANAGYSATEEWARPVNWQVEKAFLSFSRQKNEFVKV